MDRKDYIVNTHKYLGNAKRKARNIMLYDLAVDVVNIELSINGIIQKVIYKACRVNDKHAIIEREV